MSLSAKFISNVLNNTAIAIIIPRNCIAKMNCCCCSSNDSNVLIVSFFRLYPIVISERPSNDVSSSGNSINTDVDSSPTNSDKSALWKYIVREISPFVIPVISTVCISFPTNIETSSPVFQSRNSEVPWSISTCILSVFCSGKSPSNKSTIIIESLSSVVENLSKP